MVTVETLVNDFQDSKAEKPNWGVTRRTAENMGMQKDKK